MKYAPAALVAMLNALRPTSDAPLLTAECFTIWLAKGTVLTYTDLDIPVALNDATLSRQFGLDFGVEIPRRLRRQRR